MKHKIEKEKFPSLKLQFATSSVGVLKKSVKFSNFFIIDCGMAKAFKPMALNRRGEYEHSGNLMD